MRRIVLLLLALCGFAASSQALQFDLLATRVAAGTQLSDMSATLAFAIDGVPDQVRAATTVAGPDGSPLKYHFVFNYDAIYLPLQDCDTGPCSSVSYSLLTVTVCGNSATRTYGNLEYTPAFAFPTALPSTFGPGNQPYPACPLDPICGLSVSSLDFGTVTSPANATRTFTITNTGEAGSTLSGTVVTDNPVYTITAGDTYALAQGASQVVTVEMSGATTGTHTCNINAGALCAAIPCTGVVEAGPACGIEPTSLDFGTSFTDVAVDRTFTITNTGGGTLSGTVTETCDGFSILSGGSYSLTGGQSQVVTVRLLSATPNDFACDVEPGGDCVSVACTGTVLQGPICSVDAGTLDFGTNFVNSPTTRTFTITNTGGGTLTGTLAEACAPYTIGVGLTYSLAAAESLVVPVTFESATPGDYPCTIDVGGSCADVVCSGVAEAFPACSVSSTTVALANTIVNVAATGTFTISNVGGGTLSGTVTEACPEFSISSGATYSLTVGQSQVVTVELLSATPGLFECTLDSGGDCTDVVVSGTVEPAPFCTVGASLLDFGNTFVGAPVERTFTISNTGGGTLSGTVTETSDDYAITSGATYSLTAGQSQVVTIVLTAVNHGTVSATIDTGGDCDNVTCTAEVDLNPACSVSVESLDFGLTPRNTAVYRSFTITNTGGGVLTGTMSESCDAYTVMEDLANRDLSNSRVDGPTYNLTAGQTFYGVVTFSSDVPGNYPCTLDLGGSCPDIVMSGAIDPDPACSVIGSLDFGSVYVNTPATQDFTITNTGGGQLTGTVSETCPEFAILAGGGAFSLGGGQSLTVTVEINAPAPGPYVCEVQLDTACGAVHCTATADFAEICSLSADSLDFGNIVPDATADRSFTITNTGGGTLTGAFTESCDAFTILSGAAYSLGAGQSQTVTVRLQSSVQGPYTCTLDSGGLCGDVQLSGVVEALPACHVSPSFLDFGTMLTGQERTMSFTITNFGGHILAGTCSAFCTEFVILSGADYSLGAGQSQEVVISFTAPTSGSYACPIVGIPSCVNSVVPCIANVLDPADCSITPTSLDFGLTQVGVPVTRSFTIRNAGHGVLTGTVSVNDPHFTLLSGSTFDLAYNQTQVVTVQLLSATVGTFTCTVTPTNICGTVSGTGNVEPAPACQLSAASLDFGLNLPSSPVVRQFSITNTGGGTLSGAVALTCGNFVLTSPAAYSLTNGQSQTFMVDFLSPTPGVFTCSLDTGGSCADLALSGEVQVAPACQVSAASLDFGLALPGQTVERTFTVTNAGGHTLSGTVSEESAEFSIVSGAAYSLTAGQSQTVTVAFASDATGAFDTLLDAGGSCGDISCSAAVQSAPACELSVSSLDFGLLLPGDLVTRTFTISNTGGHTLSGLVSADCEGYSIVGEAGYSLTGGQSQEFTVQFQSAGAGVFACTIDTGDDCDGVSCTANVEPAPACSVDVTSLDFGLALPGQIVSRTFTITNSGGHMLAGSVSENGDGYNLVGDIDYNLGMGLSDTFTIEFASDTPGIHTCVIETGGDCAPVSCTAEVQVAPACAVDPATLDFGTSQPDVPVTRTFTITNTGGGTLSGSVSEQCNAYSITAGGDYSLTAGQSQTVTVVFQAAVSGSYPCTLSTGGDCGDVVCAAAVDLLPACSVDPVNLDFGTVLPNTPVTRTFTITNTGGGTLSGTVSEACAPYTITGGAAYSLTAGQSQTVTVSFQNATAGTFPCSLDTGGDCADVACTGTVELAPACAVSVASLDFGTVLPNTPVTRTFTITNTGGGTLSGTVTADCGDIFTVVTGAAYSLTAGQSQTVTALFQSATAGTFVCALDTDGSCANVAVTGAVLAITVASGPNSACGFVDVLGHDAGATVGFVPDWHNQLVGLNITPAPATNVTVSTWVNGAPVGLSSPATASWRPAIAFIDGYINQNIELFFQVSDGFNTWNSNGSVCLWDLTFLDVTEQMMPKVFALSDAAPNPFNPSTHLRLAVPTADNVSLRVMDLQGRLVEVLFEGPLAAGLHDFVWQPRNIASGSYFVVATGRSDNQVKRVLFLK